MYNFIIKEITAVTACFGFEPSHTDPVVGMCVLPVVGAELDVCARRMNARIVEFEWRPLSRARLSVASSGTVCIDKTISRLHQH